VFGAGLLLLLTSTPLLDPRALAPDYAYFTDTLERTESLLCDADALRTALARIHNRWAERAKATPAACSDQEASGLAARARAVGEAYRDAAQSARVSASRITRALGSPTLAPITTGPDRRRSAQAIDQSREHVRSYLELSKWHAVYLGPFEKRCKPALMPGPGLSSTSPRAATEVEERTAVIGVGNGRVCPLDAPANGQAVVLKGMIGCYGKLRCDCVPAAVLPGAVLGQEPKPSAP
jgi:hypothetical protein